MSSTKEIVLRQRRRELDARRSKSRVRLGSCLQSWAQLKDKLGFSLHSELAQHLLESYVSRVCMKCSGDGKGETVSTTKESLQELILMVHNHGQMCPLPPVLQCRPVPKTKTSTRGQSGRREEETEPKKLAEASECFKYTCEDGHHFLWCPIDTEKLISKSDSDKITSSAKRLKRDERQMKETITDTERQEMMTRLKTRQQQRENADIDTNKMLGQNKNADVTATPEAQDRNDLASDFSYSEHGSPADSDEMTVDVPVRVHIENQSRTDSYEEDAVLNLTNRGAQSSADHTEKRSVSKKTGILQSNSSQSLKRMSQIGGKRKRKLTSKLILSCEFEGCDKIFSSRQYLNHHIKYQHLHQKTFTCSHPSCRKSFNFKKHLKEHEKLHSNQRDYICEFCARAFRTSSNLIIHRRIHTGEKPLQCEVCGFTCRQKASLNWHMRKHNAESTYQFPCEICGRRFEKRDNVTAHRSKSHPDYNAGSPERSLPLPPSDPLLHPSRHLGSSPSVSKNQTTAE
ncbi:zinc finger protein 692 [Danio aesculapii]|uniref:zinc finger protein 692 n=1 Tax=Danio aesculapii TaxID=1142201 RepID=UPI0024C0DEDF|nr:zinc finger protein 692 [Danio aesculapii]